MKYHVTLNGGDDGYIAECPDLSLAVRSLSPSNALDLLRDEIRYRVELCPCTSVAEDDIQLVINR